MAARIRLSSADRIDVLAVVDNAVDLLLPGTDVAERMSLAGREGQWTPVVEAPLLIHPDVWSRRWVALPGLPPGQRNPRPGSRFPRRLHPGQGGHQVRPPERSSLPPLGFYWSEEAFGSTGRSNTLVEHFCWRTEGRRLMGERNFVFGNGR